MQPVLNKTLEMLTEEVGLPGAVVALFENDKVTFIDKYGLADKEAGREMTLNCSFDIASCSKAFTVMLAAQAVDEGLIGWDQPIKDVFPEFEMYDKYAGEHLSIRDMASHRSGLPSHDFLREKVGGSRRNLALKCKYLEPNKGFRTKYEYNNHMFIVLGYVLELLYGKTWEELVREKIAKPLGIKDIRFRGTGNWKEGLERALPYLSDGHTTRLTGYADSEFSGPCGGIKLNLPDLLKWVMAMARGGICEDGTRLCSEQQYKEIITPVIPSPEEDAHRMQGSNYAMAWHTAVYNGQPIVLHSGGLAGFNTQVGFFPGQNKGYAMIFNNGGNPASSIIRNMALDTLTNGKPDEDYKWYLDEWRKNRDTSGEEAIRNSCKPLAAADYPDVPALYIHPAYEECEIYEENGELRFEYGGLVARIYSRPNGELCAYALGDTDMGYGESLERIDVKFGENSVSINTGEIGTWVTFTK